MGRYDKEDLGNFGKVDVVKTFGKGTGYLKSKASKTRDRDVPGKSEIPRIKFKLASHFINAITSVVAIAFRDCKTKATARANALSNASCPRTMLTLSWSQEINYTIRDICT